MNKKYKPWVMLLLAGLALKLFSNKVALQTQSFINLFGTEIEYNFGGFTIAIIAISLGMMLLIYLRSKRQVPTIIWR